MSEVEDQYEKKMEFLRAFVSDKALYQTRSRLIDILSKHVGKDFTMIETVLVQELFDLSILAIKKVKLQGGGV